MGDLESDREILSDASPSPCLTPVNSPNSPAPLSPLSSLVMSLGLAYNTDEELIRLFLPLKGFEDDDEWED